MSDKTILEQWRAMAYDQQADRNKLQQFWAAYFNTLSVICKAEFLFYLVYYILSIVMQQVFQKKLCQFPYFLFKEFCRCLKLKNPPWIIIYPGFYIFNVPVLFFVKIFPFWNMAAD